MEPFWSLGSESRSGDPQPVVTCKLLLETKQKLFVGGREQTAAQVPFRQALYMAHGRSGRRWDSTAADWQTTESREGDQAGNKEQHAESRIANLAKTGDQSGTQGDYRAN